MKSQAAKSLISARVKGLEEGGVFTWREAVSGGSDMYIYSGSPQARLDLYFPLDLKGSCGRDRWRGL